MKHLHWEPVTCTVKHSRPLHTETIEPCSERSEQSQSEYQSSRSYVGDVFVHISCSGNSEIETKQIDSHQKKTMRSAKSDRTVKRRQHSSSWLNRLHVHLVLSLKHKGTCGCTWEFFSEICIISAMLIRGTISSPFAIQLCWHVKKIDAVIAKSVGFDYLISEPTTLPEWRTHMFTIDALRTNCHWTPLSHQGLYWTWILNFDEYLNYTITCERRLTRFTSSDSTIMLSLWVQTGMGTDKELSR